MTFSIDSCSKPGFIQLTPIFLVSAVILAFQILLMRILAISSWHHFAYFIVSTALLGFGVSGTILSIFKKQLVSDYKKWSHLILLLFQISIPLCLYLVNSLSIDFQYIFYSWRQAGLVLIYHLLIIVPFTIGATLIGLAFVYYKEHSSLVYGANLLGSSIGVILIVFLLSGVSPLKIVVLITSVSTIAVIINYVFSFEHSILKFRSSQKPLSRIKHLSAVLFISVVSIFFAINLKEPVTDPYKAISTFNRWEQQNRAEFVKTVFNPRSRLDLVSSPNLHQTLFAGLKNTELPPPQYALLADGHLAGVIFRTDSNDSCKILDYTPQSLPYRLYESHSVLLLGERDGTNIWLAKRFGAEKITVVQPDPILVKLWSEIPDKDGGAVFKSDEVNIICLNTRQFLSNSEKKYDIIQVCEAEGMAAGVSGLLSLHENYLLTVEGIENCISRLNPGGVVSITRGLQTPPRDNLKIMSTFAEVCRSFKQTPSGFLFQTHNYLAANNLLFKNPVDSIRYRLIFDTIDSLGLTIDYGQSREEELLNIDNHVSESYYDLQDLSSVTGYIFSSDHEKFIEDWAFDIRPATDNRPYFYQFFRWKSLPKFINTYGIHFLQRMEMGYLVAVMIFFEALIVSLLLVLIPAFWLNRHKSGKDLNFNHLYFVAIGFGYLFFEIVSIQRFTWLFGHPILSASFTIGCLLFFSGLGSLTIDKTSKSRFQRIEFIIGAVFILLLLTSILFKLFQPSILNFSTFIKLFMAGCILAPAGYLMGRPFPVGLKNIAGKSTGSVSFAWAINGFSSVIAAPLAVIIAVSQGFLIVSIMAGGFYLLALAIVYFHNISGMRFTH